MKFYKQAVALLITAAASTGITADAQNLKDILSNSGDIISNVVEGVFSSSDITVADLAGEWTSSGPAVSFKSDNLLKKAGGIAAAAAIENKVAPYYKQLGLDGAVFTVNPDGSFSIKLKMLALNGTIQQLKDKKGEFTTTFKVMGMSIGNINTYIQKTSQSMDVMFDATKLKQLLTSLANLTGNSTAKTIGSVLDGYDGLCVGFAMDKTGNSPAAENNATVNNGSTSNSDVNNDSTAGSSDPIKKGLESLGNILKNKK